MPRRYVRGESEAVRFWTYVQRGTGCWVWTASRYPGGYGQFRRKGGPLRGTHRVAWELARGPIPEGLHVCHRCDNPVCVRPSHLWLGTHSENMQDAHRKGRIPLTSGARPRRSRAKS